MRGANNEKRDARIVELYESGDYSFAALGREYELSAARISAICKAAGVMGKHIGRTAGMAPTSDPDAPFDESARRWFCQLTGCKKQIPPAKVKYGAKFCSREHASKAKYERRKAGMAYRNQERAKLERAPLPKKDGTKRHGPVFQQITSRSDLVEPLLAGEVSHAWVAHQIGSSEAAVSRAFQAIIEDRQLQLVKQEWVRPRLTRAMMPTEKLVEVKALGPVGEGTEEFECLIDGLVRAYSVFSRRYFTLEGQRPLVEEFHLRWIRSIIVAYAVGAKQLILSPPRHGKSELLVRFAVWMIAMFPNIRIMWVAANGDVSKIMLGAVRDILENNEELIAACLPVGEHFKPMFSSNRPWSAKEIKVEQQNIVGQKSSSMLALGRTSKILSRDVDLLFTDDLEDFDTTREPAQRQYSRNKLAEIGTRKEERTAWIYIASRQHPDDVPEYIMKLEGKAQAWRIIVDAAHDPMCQLDPDDIDAHDSNGCVLFPAIRSYRWLMEKKEEMDALGIAGAFEMRYLNLPVPEAGVIFDMDIIRDQALDRSRDLGIAGLGDGRRIGGLDPASRGTQAAFAWQYNPGRLAMIDLETQEAGGFAGAHKIIEEWFHSYGIMDWRYEDNSQQVEFFSDPRTKALMRRYGIRIKPVNTQAGNKMDAELGITAEAPFYHDGTVNLPYGTVAARKKVNVLLHQLRLWSSDGVAKGRNRKTDVKMAQWFPFPDVLRWMREDRDLMLDMGAEASYPGLSSFDGDSWQTPYPGA